MSLFIAVCRRALPIVVMNVYLSKLELIKSLEEQLQLINTMNMVKESLTELYSILPHSVINCALPTSSGNSGTTFFSTRREDSTTPNVENEDNNENLPQ
jgi:hypothetical protein